MSTTIVQSFAADRVLSEDEALRVRAAMDLAARQELQTSDEIRKAVEYLYSIRLEAVGYWRKTLQELAPDGYYSDGDEECPFFSERFLYPLLGKEDARTVLSGLSRLVRLLGLE